MIFGHKGHSFEVVTSTQDIAREKALAGEAAGTIIMARAMTAGRGRRGRTWHVPPGKNVCLTAIGWPVDPAEAWQIALVAGVAVAQAVTEVAGVHAMVRFPNDVYLNNRKLAGILIETIAAPRKGYLTPLIGIGVNVNVTAEEFPEELQTKATSLLRETGREYVVGAVTGAVLIYLTKLWNAWITGPLDEAILPQWKEWADPTARRTFLIEGNPVLCRVSNITGAGIVTLEDEGGRQHSLHAAQVILGED